MALLQSIRTTAKFIPVPLGTVNEKDNQKASENKQKAQRAAAKDKAIIR